jgi:tyrosyl-tRNA synthetase
MSKSLDNYVGINEPADQIFGKLMSISDELMWRYLELLSARTLKDIQALRQAVSEGRQHPMQVKKDLAQEIAARFAGGEEARRAREGFEAKFSRKELNVEELPVHKLGRGGAEKLLLARALAEAKLADSATKARTLIGQGGVRLNGEKVSDSRAELAPGEYVVQVGKLKAAKLVVE